MRRPLVTVLTLSILLFAGATAHAEKNAAAAKQHFEEGTTAFNLGEFDRAATEYKAAYAASQDPTFLYNIAQSYRLANNLSQALFFYRSYLRNAPAAVNRAEVEERIRKLDAQLKLQQAVTTQPPNTPVAPSTRPPTHVPTETEATRPVPEPPAATPAPTEPAPTAAATPTQPAANEQLTRSAPPRRDEKPVYKKWWLWTAVGVAVVGVGLGVGLGLGLSHSSPPSTALGNTGVF